MKRERKDFHTRFHDVIHELTFPILISVVFAITFSIIIAVVGIEVPIGMLALMVVLWILLLPFRKARLLSMTFIGSAALIIALFIPDFQTNYVVINGLISDIQSVNFVGFSGLLVALFVAESLLILINGWKKTSPKLIVSKRGKTVGSHEANRLWFLPLLVLLPAGPLSFEGSWWPLLETGSASVGLMFVPFVLGFQLTVQSSLPKEKILHVGKQMLGLSMVLGLVLAGAWFYTPAVIAFAAIALIGREIIYYLHYSSEKRATNFYTNRGEGLTVIGVLPFSTAEKLGISVGETVKRVNGWDVYNQYELYEALQMNPAYCKMEVVDKEGELRFVQSSVYEGDHYQIGLLFVPDGDNSSNLSQRGLRSSAVVHKDRNGKENGSLVEEVTEKEIEKVEAVEKDVFEAELESTEKAATETKFEASQVSETEANADAELEEEMAEVVPHPPPPEIEPTVQVDDPVSQTQEETRLEQEPMEIVDNNVAEIESNNIEKQTDRETFDISAIRKEFLEEEKKRKKFIPFTIPFTGGKKAKKKQVEKKEASTNEEQEEKLPSLEESAPHTLASDEAAASHSVEEEKTGLEKTTSQAMEEEIMVDNSNELERELKEFTSRKSLTSDDDDSDDGLLLLKKELTKDIPVTKKEETDAVKDNMAEEIDKVEDKKESLPEDNKMPDLTAFYEEFRKISAERTKWGELVSEEEENNKDKKEE